MKKQKTINYINYFYFAIFTILLLVLIAIYNIYLYKEKISETYHKNNLISQRIALDSTIKKFNLLSNYIFDKEINKTNLLELLDKSMYLESENERRLYKGLFFRELSKTYEYMKKDGVRQLHFHTNDNHSFLRFHNPSKFGDDLTNTRESVKYVNEKKERVSVFETGRVSSGFRNLFPLFYNNKHLGSVEISLALKSVTDSLSEIDKRREYYFILSKNSIEPKIFENQKYLYTTSLVGTQFLEEDAQRTLLDSPETLSYIAKKINIKLSKNKEIQEKLKKQEAISENIRVDYKKYNVVFLPLVGLNNILEAYLISYALVDDEPELISFYPYLILGIILGSVLLLILLKVIKNKSENLNSEKNWFFQINDSLSEGLYVTDLESKIKYINPAGCKILGYDKNEIIGKNAHYLLHYHEKNNYSKREDCNLIRIVKDGKNFYSNDEYFRKKDGDLIPVEITAKEITNNHVLEIITTFRDLSINKELEERKDLLKTALNFCSDSIVITDKEANVEWANPAFEKLTGYKLHEIEGKKPKEFIKSGLQNEEFYEELWKTILDKKPWKGELINKKKDNSLYHEELSITPVLNFKDEIKHFIAIKQDITGKKIREKEMENFAYYDHLTDLPNRRKFEDYFENTVKSLSNNEKHIALLFLDLDKFKFLNDSKGHDYGDELLKEFSRRLKKTIRSVDFVARLGGDEFVIILEHLPKNYDESEIICKKISIKILEIAREIYYLKNFEYQTTTSIGVYILNSPKENLKDVLKKADLSLYQAKKQGRNTYYIYNN